MMEATALGQVRGGGQGNRELLCGMLMGVGLWRAWGCPEGLVRKWRAFWPLAVDSARHGASLGRVIPSLFSGFSHVIRASVATETA